MAQSRKVAVIGAGVSGLVTARELQREGHRVTVFEKSNKLGGLWVYNPQIETDPLSVDPNREIIHSSLYKSLRTNLPRQLMSFSDYPFKGEINGKILNFPGHEQVLKFLNEFAEDFGITDLIRFNAEVVRVAQIVVVIGGGPSGLDISRDIATVAKQVHLSRKPSEIGFSNLDSYANLWNHSQIDHVDESGEVTFLDGSSIHADIILHCTGYKYDFPFLETDGIVSADEDGSVGPLYKHVFPPKLSPWLSFVGIPYQTIIFLMLEVQAKWIAKVLSGKVLLPSEEEMLADVEDHNRQLEEAGIPKRHTHRLNFHEVKYMDWVAAQVGLPPVDAGIKEMHSSIYKFAAEVGYDRYRDLWDVKNLTQ
ncbi:flavin-containing monooxygenase FMO GS-OX5-like isoform X2 [Lycium ferocissimum]|uniref:flavin-containing monooxygenase FMO GS-OX5-like isoform X2 n=1 Tax=Lycium ferocissimum TaxID=112874 RepID=UPI002816545B|nr:flavin-containing monooxygenase FMO GS-OX5-like isoform X2 [Lycium ferocissimum]